MCQCTRSQFAENLLHEAQSLQQGSQGAVVCFFDKSGQPVAAKMMKGSKASAIRSLRFGQ